MNPYVSRMKCFTLLAFLLIGLIACGVDVGDNRGRLSLSLTDKPTYQFNAVYVTIARIDAHRSDDPQDSWTKILDVNKTYNLTTLGGGVRKQLGIVNLDPGHYTQMRLIIGTANSDDPAQFANYVIDTAEKVHELKIPSGVQTGVKLVQGFDINANSTTELIFDFDAEGSVVVAGNSEKYLLKPTIHAIDDSQTRTVIKGTVKKADGEGLGAANVSLQVYNAGAADYKDEVQVPWATLTDSKGAYMFFFLNLPDPITFNVVATDWPSPNPSYAPDWDQIVGAVNGNVYVKDFTLPVPAEVGTLGLKAIVADADTTKNPNPETVVTISIRQISDLEGAPMVEVMTKNIVGYDDEYLLTDITAVTVDLPVLAAGEYTVVASTPGRASLKKTIKITKAGPNNLDFLFPLPII